MSKTTHKLFERLLDYEQRSLHHDASQSGRREQHANWDGLAFRIGEFRLTCAIEAVQEILPFPQVTPVPGAREWLLGLANVRGNLVTVVDLSWLLFSVRTPITSRTRLVITLLQGRLVGLVVDEVFGQRHFHADDLVDIDAPDPKLQGLVHQSFPQGDSAWGVFALDELMRQPRFLDGAAPAAA